MADDVDHIFHVRIGLAKPFQHLVDTVRNRFGIVDIHVDQGFHTAVFNVCVMVFACAATGLIAAAIQQCEIQLLASRIVHGERQMMAAVMLRVAHKHLRGKHILPDKLCTGGEGERFGCNDSCA